MPEPAGGGMRLDRLDREILACLREDGRMSVVDIARRVDAAQNTVKRRIERMESSGGLKVVPVIEPDRVGLDNCLYVGIKAQVGKVNQVADAVRAMPEVRYLAVTTGQWDLLAEAFVGSRDQMAEFILEKVSELPGIVSTETFSVLKIAKFGYEWETPEPGAY